MALRRFEFFPISFRGSSGIAADDVVGFYPVPRPPNSAVRGSRLTVTGFESDTVGAKGVRCTPDIEPSANFCPKPPPKFRKA